MKLKYIAYLGILMISLFLIASTVQLVQAAGEPNPAAGWWEVDWYDWDLGYTASYIPQYLLPPPAEGDYALLQTDAVVIPGAAKICHSYPGISYGWTPEFRVLTAGGWVTMPTTIQWEPDVEGYALACTQAWWRGTYAVFGYYEKPAETNSTIILPPGPVPQ